MYDILKDLRVVECASFIAAPLCGLHLLQFGAEVIRIDPIKGGPDHNRWPLAPGGRSLYWEGLNKGKKSVALDLASPEGRELAQALVTAPGADSGLFLTNYPPGGFLSHATLAAKRPDLITIRVMGWNDGQTAVDYTINAAIGVPHVTGPTRLPKDEPVNHVLPAWDLTTGTYAAFALLAAERHRRKTGQGQEVSIPLSDVAIASLANIGNLAEAHLGHDRPRMGNDLFGAFGRNFETADGAEVMIIAITPRQWTGLLKTLDIKAQVQAIEAEFGISFAADEGLRFQYRDRLFPLVQAAVSTRRAGELGAAFDENGVCWSVYQTLEAALRNEPRLCADNPIFSTVKHPSGHAYPTPGPAAGIAGWERASPRPAPRFGADTDEVLAELLGLTSRRIGELHERGILAGLEVPA